MWGPELEQVVDVDDEEVVEVDSHPVGDVLRPEVGSETGRLRDDPIDDRTVRHQRVAVVVGADSQTDPRYKLLPEGVSRRRWLPPRLPAPAAATFSAFGG